MKRKIKKGVQILSDLLEVLINGQKESEKNENKKKKQSPSKNQDMGNDRYKLNESDPNLMQNLKKVENENETLPED